MTDTQLWQQLKEGRPEAWERIYREHVDALLRYGSQFCAEPGWVEDSIHDLFVELWKRRAGLGATDHIRPYLLVALRRKLIRLIKKQQKLSTLTPDEVDFLAVPSIDTTIIGGEMAAEQKEQLQHALNQLSKRQREALYLKYYEGLDYAEICQTMEINYQSVRNLVFTALQKMRKYLSVIFWWLAYLVIKF